MTPTACSGDCTGSCRPPKTDPGARRAGTGRRYDRRYSASTNVSPGAQLTHSRSQSLKDALVRVSFCTCYQNQHRRSCIAFACNGESHHRIDLYRKGNRLRAGGEKSDDEVIQGQREGQQYPCHDPGPEKRQKNVTKYLPLAGTEILARLLQSSPTFRECCTCDRDRSPHRGSSDRYSSYWGSEIGRSAPTFRPSACAPHSRSWE